MERIASKGANYFIGAGLVGAMLLAQGCIAMGVMAVSQGPSTCRGCE